jgi:hypothetical protein
MEAQSSKQPGKVNQIKLKKRKVDAMGPVCY